MTTGLSEAAERNKQPILDVLAPRLPVTGRVLEIASGTGQHCAHFARSLPDLTFVPSDRTPEDCAALASRLAGIPNVEPPLVVDVLQTELGQRFDAVYCANMIHIAPRAASAGLMRVAGSVLAPGARLFTYGPYRIGGLHTAPSNEAFEGWLLAKDPDFGVRDIGWLEQQAAPFGLELVERIPMPANNFVLVWKRSESTNRP